MNKGKGKATRKPWIIVVLDGGSVMDVIHANLPKGTEIIVREFEDEPQETLHEETVC
jgi:hypothetical protein